MIPYTRLPCGGPRSRIWRGSSAILGCCTAYIVGAEVTLASPVYYSETVTAAGIQAAHAGSCITYPTLSITSPGPEQTWR